MNPGSSSTMASSSSRTSTPLAPGRLSTTAPPFYPSTASSSSSTAAAPGFPLSLPAMALPISSGRSSGSSTRSTNSFDPEELLSGAPSYAYYPTTVLSTSMAQVPARFPPIARPIASGMSSSSSSSSPAAPDSSTTSSMNKNPDFPLGKVEIKRTRPVFLDYELGLPAVLRRSVLECINQEEKHSLQNKEIKNDLILEKRLAMGVGQDDQLGKEKQSMGVEQDQLGDSKQALQVKQEQVGKEEEDQCLRRRPQDINGDQLVGLQPPLITGKKTQRICGVEVSAASKKIAAHEEFSQFPGSEIQFGSIDPRDIPLRGRHASIAQPNPEVDRRTSGVTPASASYPEKEPKAEPEQNEKLLK